MCGIVGAISTKPRSAPDAQAVVHMREALAYRGPDQAGEYFDDSLAFGFRRLAIIDLTSGDQPMKSADGRYVIIFNGEIYNYPELRPALEKKYQFLTKSDTEVLLYHLVEHGPDGLVDLNGMFALALWDKKQQTLLLARDRFGKKPLYYAQTSDAFVFASEIKSLLAYPGVSKELDRTALARYFLFEFIPSPDSPFAHIKKLPAGGYLTLNARDNKLHVQQWWRLEELIAADGSAAGDPTRRNSGRLPVSGKPKLTESMGGYAVTGPAATKKLDFLLDQAVRYRMVADVPVGVLLSGGIDSSTIAYYMRKHTDHLHSFSVSFEEGSFNESPYAFAAAKALGTTHHDIPFGLPEFRGTLDIIRERLDEPLADASLLPTLLVSQAAKEHVTVTLDGDGADELLYGYDTFPAYHLAQVLDSIPTSHAVLQTLASLLPTKYSNFSLDFKLKSFLRGFPHPGLIRNQVWLGSFHDQELKSLLTSDWQIANEELLQPVQNIANRFSNVTALQQLSAAYLAHYLQDGILAKLDRASMYASLESRTPYLDPVLAPFLFQLPDSAKMKGLRSKIILKQLMRDRLPQEIVNRPKKGFGIPVGLWLRGPLQSLLQETLLRSIVEETGVCQWPEVSRLTQEHLSGRADHRKKLWTLMVFHWWHQKWT